MYTTIRQQNSGASQSGPIASRLAAKEDASIEVNTNGCKELAANTNESFAYLAAEIHSNLPNRLRPNICFVEQYGSHVKTVSLLTQKLHQKLQTDTLDLTY